MGSLDRSPTEKLADCRRDGLVIFALGVVCDGAGGAGRRAREFCRPGSLVKSSDGTRSDESEGVPITSSELFSFNDRRAEDR